MSEAERGAEALKPWEVLGHSMCLPPDGMDLLRDALEETRLSVVPALASVSAPAPRGLSEEERELVATFREHFPPIDPDSPVSFNRHVVDTLLALVESFARRSALPDSERPEHHQGCPAFTLPGMSSTGRCICKSSHPDSERPEGERVPEGLDAAVTWEEA